VVDGYPAMPDMTDNGLDPLEFEQLVAGRMAEVAIVTDADLLAPGGPKILYVNASFERAWEFSAAEIVGRRLEILYPGDLLTHAVAQMRAAAESHQETEILLQARRRNGKPAWVAGRNCPIFSPSGNLTCFVRITGDITAQRRTEHEMVAAQHLLGTIFLLVDQAMVVVDDANRIVMANPSFARAVAANPAELVGKRLTPWLDPADAEAPQRHCNASRRTKRAERTTVRLRLPGDMRAEAVLVTTAIDPQQENFHAVVALAAFSSRDDQPQNIDDAIRAAIADSDKVPAAVVAGKLQLIGLDEVRAKLGDRWPDFEARTFAAAEAILRRHLGPRDALSRTIDDGFLVCFADLSENEAAFKAQTLRREIAERLIGESPELLEAKVTAHIAEVAITETDTAPDIDIADAIEQRLRTDRERREAALRRSLWTEITPGRIRLDKVRTNTGQVAPLLRARAPAEIEAAIENLDPYHELGIANEAGILLLSSVAERLMSNQLPAAQELVIAPVHISTLLDKRGRESWLKVARGVDIVGKARLVVEIHGLPKDIGQARLTDLITRCAPLFRALAIELPECDTSLINDLPASARILTLPVRRAFAGQNLSPAFGRLMRMGGVKMRQLLVKDVARPNDAKQLAAAGVALIAGRDGG